MQYVAKFQLKRSNEPLLQERALRRSSKSSVVVRTTGNKWTYIGTNHVRPVRTLPPDNVWTHLNEIWHLRYDALLFYWVT
jgi:hypothetical protein